MRRPTPGQLIGVGGTIVALVAACMWLLYGYVGHRLANQDELQGLAAPLGLDWDEPAHVDSLLRTLATAFVERPPNAGIAIGITRNGTRHVVFRGVQSKSDPAVLIDEQTLFEIGSLTKAFTGIALALEVVEGRVRLDEPIDAYLPGYMDFPEHVRSIPIGAVATHSAGLPGDPPSVSLVSRLLVKNPFGKVTERQAFASLAEVSAEDSSKREYRYSNFGFMLLGRLLEEAAGVRYVELVEDRIARHLRMDNTWVEPPDSVLQHLATGHRMGEEVEHWYAIPLPGASGVVSSVPDMLTFLEAHLFPDSTPLAEAVRLSMEPRVRASEAIEVGLAWHVYAVPGNPAPAVVWHTGSMMGFRSYMGMAPEMDLGIVVLGNSRDPTIPAIGRLIMRTLLRLADSAVSMAEPGDP